MWINDQAGVLDLCRCLDRSPMVAIDTEFAAERRYFPRFDLLQVGTDEVAAAVDIRSSVDLAPLFDRLCDPGRVTVLHSGSMDLLILQRRMGRLPSRVFDTQIAAAMVGYGEHVSFAALVKRITGVYLAKAQTMTDWSRRPLKAEQVEYALDDVRYLLPLYEHLVEKLRELKRMEWLEEECELMMTSSRLGQPHPRDAWKRLSAWSTMSPRQFAVLQEVAAWREETAIARDTPPRVVLPDDVVIHLARRQPDKIKELREIRQIFERTVKEQGDAILQAIQRGLTRGEEGSSNLGAPSVQSELPAGLIHLTKAVIHAKAEEQSIAPSLLYCDGDLELLITDLTAGRSSQVPLVNGWRRDVAGRDVIHVITGTVSVGYDPVQGKIRL